MIARAIRLLSVLASVNLATLALGGNLNPPGAPAPTPGPEPRIAINDVNTPGNDDSHFRITEPGSYRLENNLIIPGTEPKHGILIETSDVTVDLCGFILDGWNPIAVPHPNSSLVGIFASGDLVNITVRNGVVRDWGDDGIDIFGADGCRVTDITAEANGEYGIQCGPGSVVARCVAVGNGESGIRAGNGSAVESCTAMSNTRDGISVGTGSTIRGCVASQNTRDGIVLGAGSTAVDCTAYDNERDGFNVTAGSTVAQCTARFNTSDGIYAGTGCLILNNTSNNNGVSTSDGAGIYVTGTRTRVEGNTVVGNDQGIEVYLGTSIVIRNTASDNTTNYDLNAATARGYIIDMSAGGNITTTNPWANFSF